MKKVIISLVLSLITAAIIISCAKDNETTAPEIAILSEDETASSSSLMLCTGCECLQDYSFEILEVFRANGTAGFQLRVCDQPDCSGCNFSLNDGSMTPYGVGVHTVTLDHCNYSTNSKWYFDVQPYSGSCGNGDVYLKVKVGTKTFGITECHSPEITSAGGCEG